MQIDKRLSGWNRIGKLHAVRILCDYPHVQKKTHMGQIPQDGESEQKVAFFLNFTISKSFDF